MSGISQIGCTILKSARSHEFLNEKGRAEAARQLREKGIEALIVIGGDGTFQVATLFSQQHDVTVVGVPATIDNDLIGSDETIGYDTALNPAIDPIYKSRDPTDA